MIIIFHILKYEWILRKEWTHYGLLNDDIRFVTHIKWKLWIQEYVIVICKKWPPSNEEFKSKMHQNFPNTRNSIFWKKKCHIFVIFVSFIVHSLCQNLAFMIRIFYDYVPFLIMYMKDMPLGRLAHFHHAYYYMIIIHYNQWL
jgi:hypothetical protein